MATNTDFVDFVAEQLSVIGPVATRSMFGGVGIFRLGVMFALIADETLYLKVDNLNRAEFEAEGLEPFSYEAKGGRKVIMSYMRCPERLFDDSDDMEHWANAAYAAAGRAKTSKPVSGRKTSARRKPSAPADS